MSHSSLGSHNFFSLFDYPIDFDIDVSVLDERLRILQQKYHPDNVATDTTDTTTHATDPSTLSTSNEAVFSNESALINHAYQILKYPDSRANYLLELAGQEMHKNATIADLDFLEQAMQLRVSLDEAANTSNMTTIESLSTQVKHKIITMSHTFKTSYDQQDWQAAIAATQKLSFLSKLAKDINATLDTIHTQIDDNDDDLYL